jgi:excisionase family DNA binding protein
MTKLNTVLTPVAPSEEEKNLARESSRRLEEAIAVHDMDTEVSSRKHISLHLGGGKRGQSVDLPASALPLVARMLSEMGQGHAVALLPMEMEITTQQAADLMNVSRPFLVGLIDQDHIPSRKVGTHRRLLLKDVLAYKERDIARRRDILGQLAADAQEQDMGY